jgi:hypothetical protein
METETFFFLFSGPFALLACLPLHSQATTTTKVKREEKEF